MKKNILAIAILAATIANIVLSAIIVLVIVPESKQSTDLIKKIVACLDLELQHPDASEFGKVPLEDRVQVVLAEKQNINLALGPNDTKARYAQVNCYLILNKKSKDYSAITSAIENQSKYFAAKLDSLVAQYTPQTIKAAEPQIASQLLEDIKTYVQSADCVLDIVVTTLVN